MGQADSLTISARTRVLRAARGVAVLAALALAGCTIEVGPPPESDPPLVPEAAKAPPPPPQPTEPQAWSRDLDLDSDPTAIDRRQLAEGLVASDAQGRYSEQRLTFQSAFEEEEKISEAERLRQKARERAEAAGLPPPPQVSAAPVAEVSAQSLDQPGEATAPQRQSRLPPPPKFPPPPAETATAGAPSDADETEMAAADPAMAAGTAAPETAGAPPQQPWEQRQSRLPPPPKLPSLPQEKQENMAPETSAEPSEGPAPDAAAGSTQIASTQGGGSAQPEAPATSEAAAETPVMASAASAEPAQAAASFAAAAWDAPSGTILVQVSAVPDAAKVAAEWQRLQARFPEVLQPLRLVVEQATLGERTAFYRVQAGGFGSQEGAAAACDRLISAGQSCFVMVR